VGLSFVLVDLSIAIWGGDPTSVPIPDVLRGPVSLGVTNMPVFRVFAIGLGTADQVLPAAPERAIAELGFLSVAKYSS
jgi:branched-subunit amino acid ABC-type transport system permease component